MLITETEEREEREAKKQLYIRQGKILLEEIGTYQAEIAKRALEICDIRHGGKTLEKIYTIKDFANDIGMKPKTLQGWVGTYRDVVLKADIEINNSDDWKAASKTNNTLIKERTLVNKLEGTPKKKGNYKKEIPATRVKSLYESIQADEKPFITELVTITQHAKHIKHILKKRELNLASDSNLTELMNILDEASDMINDHLTAKQPRVHKISAKDYRQKYIQ